MLKSCRSQNLSIKLTDLLLRRLRVMLKFYGRGELSTIVLKPVISGGWHSLARPRRALLASLGDQCASLRTISIQLMDEYSSISNQPPACYWTDHYEALRWVFLIIPRETLRMGVSSNTNVLSTRDM